MISSHTDLDENGKIMDDVKKEILKMNNSKSISSHNIVPSDREFTTKDLTEWINKNVLLEVKTENERLVKENIEALKKAK
jgi:hypothetical protein